MPPFILAELDVTALLAAERAHLVRLGAWAIASIVVGAAMLARSRRNTAPLRWHAGLQTAAWGMVDLVIVAAAWSGLAPRDAAGALALDRFLWLNIGLDVGYMAVGVTLLICGRRLGPRPGLVGAGAAVIVQGAALAVLDLVVARALAAAL